MNKLFAPKPLPGAGSIGMLVLRVLVGVALVIHGWSKVQDPMGWAGPNSEFAPWMLAFAAFGEFLGGGLLALGLVTPVAAVWVAGTMAGAVYHHMQKGDGFLGGWELAAVYTAVSFLLLTAGPGAFSVDKALFAKKS